MDALKDSKMRVFLALLMTVLGWGSSFVGIRLGVECYSPEIVTFGRYLIAAIFAIFIYIYAPGKIKMSFMDQVKCLLCGVVGMGIYSYCIGIGEQTVPASIAGFIVGMMPLCASILATFLYKEMISKRLWAGIALSVVGLSIIAFSGHDQASFGMGILWVFCATICGTAYTLMQKPLIKRIPTIQFICYCLWGAALFLLVVCCIYPSNFWSQFQSASTISTLSIVYQGIVPSIFAYLGWTYALSKVNVAKAGIVLYAMPIISALLSWLVLSEIPTPLAKFGMALAFLGSVIGSIKLKKKVTFTRSQSEALTTE